MKAQYLSLKIAVEAKAATAQLYAFALSLRRSLDRVRPHTRAVQREPATCARELRCSRGAARQLQDAYNVCIAPDIPVGPVSRAHAHMHMCTLRTYLAENTAIYSEDDPPKTAQPRERSLKLRPKRSGECAPRVQHKLAQ
ncbi:unnamed protein product, partial [Trichogramma brassicae]